ncbi:MAG: phasin family protein [Lysobacterales bacterium]
MAGLDHPGTRSFSVFALINLINIHTSEINAQLSKEFEMAKKTLKKKVMKKKVQAKPAVPVVDSAREIWLAGLGAFSVAQNEGAKVIEQGNKLFEKLVSEGVKLEKKTRNVAESAVGDIKGEVESKVGAVRKQAVDNWDKLETIFENRVARVLGQLGVPTAEEVNKLSERVQTLATKVTSMSKTAKPAPKKAAAKKPTAKKPTAKKPAAKKVVTKKATAKKPAAK